MLSMVLLTLQLKDLQACQRLNGEALSSTTSTTSNVTSSTNSTASTNSTGSATKKVRLVLPVLPVLLVLPVLPVLLVLPVLMLLLAPLTSTARAIIPMSVPPAPPSITRKQQKTLEILLRRYRIVIARWLMDSELDHARPLYQEEQRTLTPKNAKSQSHQWLDRLLASAAGASAPLCCTRRPRSRRPPCCCATGTWIVATTP